MKDIEKGTPAFEGFVSGKDVVDGNRVFIDEQEDKWYEVERGVFAYHVSQTREGAERAFEVLGYRITNQLLELLQQYPEGSLIRE